MVTSHGSTLVHCPSPWFHRLTTRLTSLLSSRFHRRPNPPFESQLYSPELRAARQKSRLQCPSPGSHQQRPLLHRQSLRFPCSNPRPHRLRPPLVYSLSPSFTARARIPLPEPAFHHPSPLSRRRSHCVSVTGRLCRRGGRAFLTQSASDSKIESVTPGRMSLGQNGHLIWR